MLWHFGDDIWKQFLLASAKTRDTTLSRSKVRSNERSDKRMCFKKEPEKKQTKEGKDKKRSKTSNKGRDKRDQESVHNE